MKKKATNNAKPAKTIKLPFIEVKQKKKKFWLTAMPASVLVQISYVAERRKSKEKGAVQRPLNDKRIGKIATFAQSGGDFPAGIILNWMEPSLLSISGNTMTIKIQEDSAQLIDGQHRDAGLEEAIIQDKSLASVELPVAIYSNLNTRECADIFLSINTEQKPVPPSLAFDLFGVASSHVADPAAVRALDIAKSLNDEDESPYRGLVRFVGEPAPTGRKAKLGIPLSTFVNALKPLVAENTGIFPSFKVSDLKNQTSAITAFYKVLQEWYGDQWLSRDNAFMHGAGITGSADFFKQHMIQYCAGRKSYSSATMRSALRLDGNLISKKEAERLGGRAMARTVKDLLIARFIPSQGGEEDIEFD